MFVVVQLLLTLSLTTRLVHANRGIPGGGAYGYIPCGPSPSEWGECSDECGNAGVATRNVSYCDKIETNVKPCNRFCHNRGVPRAGYCDCPAGFGGKCCEHELCSWRPDSVFCYPGRCPDAPSSCRCAPGFLSTNCLTINAKPNVTRCLVTVQGSRGSYKAKTETHCESDTKTVVYTNLIPSTIRFDLEHEFKGPPMTDYPAPYYVNEFKVGVTEATFTYTLEHGGVRQNEIRLFCNSNSSQLNPRTGLVSCAKECSLSNSSLQHSDRIHIKVASKNGGYVKLNEYDNGTIVNVSEPIYYTGQTRVHMAELIIDLIKPFHCSVGYSCSDNMLDRGLPITKSTNFAVSWKGWSDSFSGIKQYHLTLYKMDVVDNELSNNNIEPIVNTTFDSDKNNYNSTLSEPGVYAVLLAVEDMAGSKQVARRFFIFDDTSDVSINTEGNRRLKVNSAKKNTSYTWLTSLQDVNNTGEQVEVTWHGYFANVYQHNHKFLDGIGPNSPPIQAGYEELTGQPPDTVSREAIPNVNAIVRYDVSFAVDHLGGRSIHDPARWTNVAAFHRETVTVDIPRADGDSVRVWVRATDVMGNTKTDSVLVHVDSSPPVIQDVRVDGTRSTYDVDAYDFQSGLKEIRWQIRNSREHGKVYDDGILTARSPMRVPSDCIAPRCYCIPKNNECYLRHFGISPDMDDLTQSHNQNDADYELVVTVVNNAMMTATTVRACNVTGSARASLQVAAIAGGSAAAVAVIAFVTVAVICCLVMKSRTRKTDSEINTNESKNESDVETPVYTSLNFKNPDHADKTVVGGDATYENP